MSLPKEKSVVVKFTRCCIFFMCVNIFFSLSLAITSDNVRPYTFTLHEILKLWIQVPLDEENWENILEGNFLSSLSISSLSLSLSWMHFWKIACSVYQCEYSTMKIAKGGKIMMEWMWKISAHPRMHSSIVKMSIFHQSSVA